MSYGVVFSTLSPRGVHRLASLMYELPYPCVACADLRVVASLGSGAVEIGGLLAWRSGVYKSSVLFEHKRLVACLVRAFGERSMVFKLCAM